MLNLNELKNKHYEIMWFDGITVLQLKKPSQGLWDRLMKLSELKDTDIKDMTEIVYDILYEAFNANLNGKSFTIDEIKENFDLETAFVFINDWTQSIIPNLGE